MQGKGFRDRIPEFAARNAVVLGVSCDRPADNRAFRDKFEFPFDLLSDEDGGVSMRYGAADSAHTTYPARIGYLLDPFGTVVKAYAKVDPATHAEQVLADLQASTQA